MPRLQWRYAHHRDLPTRPETAIPRTAQKGRSMTRRTSTFHGHPLNCNSFRANTGLSETEFTVFSTPELHETGLVKEVQVPQISAGTTQSHHLGSIMAALASSFPHRSHPDPTAPPSHVSQRGPHSAQIEKSRQGPHRKTLNLAAVGLLR